MSDRSDLGASGGAAKDRATPGASTPGPLLPEQDRTVERTKAFTDAVVAIALTLLVLPLLDGVPDAVREQVPVGEWARQHAAGGAFFAMSFVLIARYWQGHERIFRYTQSMSRGLFRANTLWMFGIAWMPVGTALLSTRSDLAQVVFYIVPMLLCGAAQAVMAVITGRQANSPMPTRMVASSLANAVLMAVALALAIVLQEALPEGRRGLSFMAMWIVLLTLPVSRRLFTPSRRLLHRSAAADA